MSEITITTATTKRDLKRFMRFPRTIYRNDPKWVPPVESDQIKTLSKTYPFFEHGDAELFLAWRDGKIVGRISAHVNDSHLEKYDDGMGFFGWFECIDDQAVCDALLAAAREWLSNCGRKIERFRGPFQWDINGENTGVLIEDHRPGPPALLMPHSATWYDRLLLNAGMAIEKNLNAYVVKEADGLSDDIMRVADMAARRLPEFITRPMHFDHRFEDDLKVVRELYNSAWSENWGSVDLSEAEVADIGKGLKPIARREITSFLEIEGKPVAFIICLPDINPLIQKIDGKLFPFGWLRFLLGVKKITALRTMLLGVHEDYRRRGLDPILLRDIINNGRKLGFNQAELSWILEDNKPMTALANRLGTHDRTYRIYQQEIEAKQEQA